MKGQKKYVERYILTMIIAKYFYYRRDRDFKKAESLIKPKRYFTVLSARLMSGDVV